jgi:anti-sigma factor RsiW
MARWAGVPPIRIETVSRTKRRLGQLLLAAALLAAGAAAAQEDKKTDDDKPADPDTGAWRKRRWVSFPTLSKNTASNSQPPISAKFWATLPAD